MRHEWVCAAAKGKTWKVSQTFQVSYDGLGEGGRNLEGARRPSRFGGGQVFLWYRYARLGVSF